MLNSLALATRGRISPSTKKTLTLATIGRIVIVDDTQIEEPSVPISYPKPYFDYNGGVRRLNTDTKKQKDTTWILLEDREIIAIVQFTIKTVII